MDKIENILNSQHWFPITFKFDCSFLHCSFWTNSCTANAKSISTSFFNSATLSFDPKRSEIAMISHFSWAPPSVENSPFPCKEVPFHENDHLRFQQSRNGILRLIHDRFLDVTEMRGETQDSSVWRFCSRLGIIQREKKLPRHCWMVCFDPSCESVQLGKLFHIGRIWKFPDEWFVCSINV
jgi:hypothetical protein